MKKPVFLAITGFRGCGKDYFVDKFLKNIDQNSDLKDLKFKKIAFADILKDYVTALTGYTRDEIELYKRQNDVKFLVGKKKYNTRQFLINTANSLRELSDDGIWAKLVLNKVSEYIQEGVIPIITDLRFEKESKLIKEFAKENNYENFIIYIQSDTDLCKKSINNEDEKEINEINKDIEIKLPDLNKVSKKDKQEIFDKIIKDLSKML